MPLRPWGQYSLSTEVILCCWLNTWVIGCVIINYMAIEWVLRQQAGCSVQCHNFRLYISTTHRLSGYHPQC